MNTELMKAVKTMSSLEIAELTGKRHDHVLTDIRNMLKGLKIAATGFSGTAFYEVNNAKRERQIFNLPKRECLILVSGYNLLLRTAIIDRWQELEEGEATPAVVVTSSKKEKLDMELLFIQSAATFLRVSDSSKLEMMHIVGERNGISTAALPQFTEKVRKVCSATHLLEQNNCPIKVRAFNILLIKHGVMEKIERLASHGKKKKYNSLTEKGLKFGQNDAFKGSSTQTQVHLYSDTFMDLYDTVTA